MAEEHPIRAYDERGVLIHHEITNVFKDFNADVPLIDLVDLACAHVGDLCAGRKTWRMCIPVQADDSDTLIAGALRRAKAEILALRTQRDNILALYDSVQASALAEMRRKKP